MVDCGRGLFCSTTVMESGSLVVAAESFSWAFGVNGSIADTPICPDLHQFTPIIRNTERGGEQC